MLVLSRHPQETIVFPNVGVTLEVLRVKGQVVRLGVKAPSDVEIKRGELLPDGSRSQKESEGQHHLRHQMRNRLNSISMSVELLQRQLDQNVGEDANANFQNLLTDLQSLDELLQKEEQVQTLSSQTSSPEKEKEEVEKTSSFRVLVVEDDDNERKLLADLLSLSGWNVDTVCDGVQALEYLKAYERPDFVLLDMSMPRCTGSEVLSVIRENEEYQDLRVFAVSGRTSESTGVPIGPDGVDGWFRKPLNTKRLIDSISRTASSA